MSKKAKFTDGDWTENGSFIKHSGSNMHICLVNSAGKTSREYIANKNLILAAPKMYHALKALTEACNKYDLTELVPEYEQAISALQKADGE